MAVDDVMPDEAELARLADGKTIPHEPLDPEHQAQVEAWRIARLIEEGNA